MYIYICILYICGNLHAYAMFAYTPCMHTREAREVNTVTHNAFKNLRTNIQRRTQTKGQPGDRWGPSQEVFRPRCHLRGETHQSHGDLPPARHRGPWLTTCKGGPPTHSFPRKFRPYNRTDSFQKSEQNLLLFGTRI